MSAIVVDRRRIRTWCVPALALQLCAFLFAVAGTHGLIVPLDKPATTDFVSFYAAGIEANGPDAAISYDPASHYRTEQAVTAPGIGYVHFFYPPPFLLVCSLLARLPYLAAFVVFELLSLALLLGALRLILRDTIGSTRHLWLLPVLSFSPVFWNIGVGQNACLTAGLLGFGTLLLHRRHDVAAGLVLACLCYKPHVGLLIPVALVAGSRWRATAVASAMVAALGGWSTLLFQQGIWPAFLHRLLHAAEGFSAGQVVPFTTLVSLYGSARLTGLSPVLSHGFELVASLLVTACVAWSWRRSRRNPAETPLACSLLVSGAVLVMPVALFYELVALLVAAAWLIAAGRGSGLTPRERLGLGAAWVLGLLCYPLERALGVPAGLACPVILFLLCLSRQFREVRHLPSRNHADCTLTRDRTPSCPPCG